MATPVPQPFVRLELWIRGDEASGPSFVQYYVRDAKLVALQTGPDAWAWVRAGRLRPLFDRVAAKVTPFTRPRITRITIAGASVKGAASYARLVALHGKAQSFPNEPDWKPIRIETARPGPWSTNATTLEYSPSKKVLWRGSEFVDVPTELAVRLEAGRSLEASDGRSFPLGSARRWDRHGDDDRSGHAPVPPPGSALDRAAATQSAACLFQAGFSPR